MKYKEDAELMAFFDWIRIKEKQYPELSLIYHIGNERKTTPQAGARLKKKGVRKGVPDVCVPIPRNRCHGLYIEFKIKPNKLTPEQKEFSSNLEKQRYAVCVAYSALDAISMIKEYLSL